MALGEHRAGIASTGLIRGIGRLLVVGWLGGGTATAAAPIEVERQAYLMGTRCTIAVSAPTREEGMAAIEAAFGALRATEDRISTWRPESAFSRLNAGPVDVSIPLAADLIDLLSRAGGLWKATGGAFDPAIGRLLAAWDVRGEGREPSDAEIREALAGSGMRLIELRPGEGAVIRRSPGAVIEEGAFGKGEGVAVAARALAAAGITDWIIDFGGQVSVAPDAPRRTIGLAHPRDRLRSIGVLRIPGLSASTSAGRRADAAAPGKPALHILDPRTGRPSPDFGSVTVIGPDPMEADALSTALFVMGPEEGVRFAESLDSIEAVFLVDRGDRLEAVATSGAGRFIEGLEPGVIVAGPYPLAVAARVAGAAPAEPESAPEAPPDVEELERRIDVLAEEVERLRAGEATAEDDDEASRHGLGPAAGKIYGREHGVSIGGYGEMLYENFDSRRDDGSPGGMTDRLDFVRGVFYFGYRFSDRILFNSEVEYEHASTGENGEASLEFAYLDFLLRPAIGIRAGLLLVPMGFINEIHEPPTFLGARRPDVERVILPATWRENGAGVFGEAGNLAYRAYVINGMDGAGLDSDGYAAAGIRGGRQKGSESLAEDFAFVGRLDWTVVPGLVLGGSYYTGGAGQGAVAPLSNVEIEARTTIGELHAEWRWRGLRSRVLWAESRIDDVPLLNESLMLAGTSTIGERQEGGYVEAGYDVLPRADTGQSLIPFVRLETYNTQVRVPAGTAVDPARDIDLRTYGLSYLPIPQVAVKLDFQDYENAAGTGRNQWNVAVGFYF